MIKEIDFNLDKAIQTGELPAQICNMCGKAFDEYDYQENVRFDHYFGYGSKYDLHHLDLNLCCQCTGKVLDWILPQCKHNPLMHESEAMSCPSADCLNSEE